MKSISNIPNSYINLNDSCIVGLNIGYGLTKVRYDDKIFYFESKVSEYVDEDLNNTVVINDVRYAIGCGTQKLDLDKTKSIHHKALIKYALSKIPYKYKKVVVALPSNSYIIKETREEYKQLLLSFEDVIDCIVYLEGASLVFYDSKYFDNSLVCLLDIGSYTINFGLYASGKLQKGSSFSRDLGCTILFNRIRKAIEQTSLCNVPDIQIPYLMDKPIVSSVLHKYFDEIKYELKKAQYPSNVKTRITGGTCLHFKNQFKQYFNADIGENPIFENANGLYLIGKEMFVSA